MGRPLSRNFFQVSYQVAGFLSSSLGSGRAHSPLDPVSRNCQCAHPSSTSPATSVSRPLPLGDSTPYWRRARRSQLPQFNSSHSLADGPESQAALGGAAPWSASRWTTARPWVTAPPTASTCFPPSSLTFPRWGAQYSHAEPVVAAPHQSPSSTPSLPGFSSARL
jgi:hypothetical protein